MHAGYRYLFEAYCTLLRASSSAKDDEYAKGIVTALNTDGLQPFTYATVEATSLLDEIEASLEQLSKKGERLAQWSPRS